MLTGTLRNETNSAYKSSTISFMHISQKLQMQREIKKSLKSKSSYASKQTTTRNGNLRYLLL